MPWTGGCFAVFQSRSRKEDAKPHLHILKSHPSISNFATMIKVVIWGEIRTWKTERKSLHGAICSERADAYFDYAHDACPT